MAEGFLDLDVRYEKKRHENAILMRQKLDNLNAENLKKREYAKELEQFDAQIKGDDKQLSMGTIRRLDTIKKNHLID